jgi:hypothetical protein
MVLRKKRVPHSVRAVILRQQGPEPRPADILVSRAQIARLLDCGLPNVQFHASEGHYGAATPLGPYNAAHYSLAKVEEWSFRYSKTQKQFTDVEIAAATAPVPEGRRGGVPGVPHNARIKP